MGTINKATNELKLLNGIVFHFASIDVLLFSFKVRTLKENLSTCFAGAAPNKATAAFHRLSLLCGLLLNCFLTMWVSCTSTAH